MTTTIGQVGVVRTPRHLYYFNGQGPWPGVTSITDVLDKPALLQWHKEQIANTALSFAARLVEDKAAGNEEAAVKFLLASRNTGTNSRERGTRLHTALEGVLKRENPAIDPRDIPAVNGARLWMNESGLAPLEVEGFVINETLGYGGTFDLIGTIPHEVSGVPENWMLDWKSSKSVVDYKGKLYAEHRLQLSAYANAEFIAKPGDGERYPIPPIDRYGILHVTDAGTRLFEAKVTDDDWITFRACLWIHGWQAAQKRAA